FVAAMLILVLADSYALLFVGWEGVGLASYLLIGFWNQRTDYAVAAKKAFVMNRVGDMGLLIGMGALFATVGSVEFDEVFAAVPGLSEGWLTAIGLALLLGACGKSAQFPLQAWLGDAMAGPTPVSALIHAATMVTAGVYLIVRSGPIFEAAPTAQLVVAVVGAVTLLFGAIVGCAKDDIKKALAASTMSQIGYMMLAAGLGPIGYAFAIFHLFTHGIFKAGMFLGAGSVMHGMNDEVNMRGFGGLSRYMRVTWITFGLGWLAILGIPPFSGFWSKDKIIEAAVRRDRPRGAAVQRREDRPAGPGAARRRVPRAPDRRDDRPRAGLGRPRWRADGGGVVLPLAGAGHRARRAPRAGGAGAGRDRRDPRPRRAGRLPRLAPVLGRARAGHRPRRVGAHPGRTSRPVPGRRQRGGLRPPGHAPGAHHDLRRHRRRRRRRQRPRGRGRRLGRAAAEGP